MTKAQSYENVAATIRKLSRDPETKWTYGSFERDDGGTHAKEEFKADRIELTDVPYCLKRCRVTRADWSAKYQEMRYTAESRNVDNRPMAFVVTFSEEPKKIEVVTGWVRR